MPVPIAVSSRTLLPPVGEAVMVVVASVAETGTGVVAVMASIAKLLKRFMIHPEVRLKGMLSP